MNNQVVSLAELPLGHTGRVCELRSTDRSRRRMLDLGLIVDTEVEALRRSPSGDPVAYQIRGAVIALRREEAATVLVAVCS